MKKKIFIFATIAIFLAIFASLLFVFIFQDPKSTISAENATGQSPASASLKSFRGVLTDVIENVEAETKKIVSEITNPFSGKKTPEAPATDQNNPDEILSFAIIGDTQRFTAGNPNGNFQKAVANISKISPNMAIAVGDLVSNCKGKSDDATDYANWKNILGSLASKTYAVQGNHDRVENGEKCDQFWQNTFSFPANGPAGFSELTYSLDLKNSHFVFLDSDRPDDHQINNAQRTWLEQDLAKNKMENTFIFFHEPAFPTGAKIGESLDTQASERNALWQIIDKYNVTAVFNGHEHIVSRRKIDSKVFPSAKNSIYQFVFANTDSFNHDLPRPGVAEYSSQIQGSFGLVKVNGKEITVETHGPDGKVLNTFTFSK
jgi:3',5'-cyclic-AMP phosphodiesterase